MRGCFIEEKKTHTSLLNAQFEQNTYVVQKQNPENWKKTQQKNSAKSATC